jgi:TRAP-type transport system periplasmic protein
MTRWIVCFSLLVALPVRAEPRWTLRMATPAPEGTAWARELKSFSREVEAGTHGDVRMKWYLGGIAGDELQIGERIKRDQLDGAGAGGMLCERLAPSMRVLRLLGVFQSRAEAAYVMQRLQPSLEGEFAKSGFSLIGSAGLGPEVIFLRNPVHSLAELRKVRLWRWDLDVVAHMMSVEIGMQVVSLPLEQAARAYDEGRTDGFLGIPTAALAFQWSTQARYLLDLRTGYLQACLIIANRAVDRLPPEHRDAIRTAAAKLQARLEDIGREQDAALLGGLFAKQGLKVLVPSESFRAEFWDAARASRDRLGEKLVPKPLLDRVMGMLADFRAEHRKLESER